MCGQAEPGQNSNQRLQFFNERQICSHELLVRELSRARVRLGPAVQRVRRAGFVFIVLVAAAIALEPLIHTHPLTQSSSTPCAVCVTAVGRLTALSPAPAAPLTIVASVPVLRVASIIHRTTLPLASRAPPAL
jgi:hypothetical protein